MNSSSHSNVLSSDCSFLPELPGRPPDSFGDEKRDCERRVRETTRRLKQIDAGSELMLRARRRLETAGRFLRSDELGCCNYELRAIDIMIHQMQQE